MKDYSQEDGFRNLGESLICTKIIQLETNYTICGRACPLIFPLFVQFAATKRLNKKNHQQPNIAVEEANQTWHNTNTMLDALHFTYFPL